MKKNYQVIRKNCVIKVDGKKVAPTFSHEETEEIKALKVAKYIKEVKNG